VRWLERVDTTPRAGQMAAAANLQGIPTGRGAGQRR